ncbi:hypothetical protein JCGZ_20320 [Jatropha curcas]|uniref:Uncharacterized protein n=1 Tax=Jatropha curcas TaxID=180498 RepID=A0A067JT11_JATCU|nr:uncharacterized protein LOC105644226 [Jatropha curcas]KDP27096.1 hypothetical protein JCGZ_20320 [Jatropha curcas]
MSLFRTILFKPQNLLYKSDKLVPIIFNSDIYRSFTSSPQNQSETQTDQNEKPLSLLFQQAVGLCDKDETDVESGSQSNELQKKLLDLEREVRDLKETESKNGQENQILKKVESEKPNSLHVLFEGKRKKNVELKDEKENRNGKKVESAKPNSLYVMFKEGKRKDNAAIKRKEEEGPRVFKEFSSDMKIFLSHLYENGYLKEANFLRRGELDFNCFNDSYGRGFIRFAVEKFGQDHQEIAKWLSGSDLKKVALFGCPSLTKKNVFSAKRLRNYFKIQENTVCDKCVLKHSCKFVNQSVWKGDYRNLNLAVAMRAITLYALEEVEPELLVPDEIKASVSRLLKEVLRLSKTVM